MAGVTGRADLKTGPGSQRHQQRGAGKWEEVASAIIARLGRDREDGFSPSRFLTDRVRKAERRREGAFCLAATPAWARRSTTSRLCRVALRRRSLGTRTHRARGARWARSKGAVTTPAAHPHNCARRHRSRALPGTAGDGKGNRALVKALCAGGYQALQGSLHGAVAGVAPARRSHGRRGRGARHGRAGATAWALKKASSRSCVGRFGLSGHRERA